MIDTRLKVDGKWNFDMSNVWFLFCMFMFMVWTALELTLTYANYELTGDFRVGFMFFFNIIFMMILLMRRVVDKTIKRVDELQKRIADLESGE